MNELKTNTYKQLLASTLRENPESYVMENLLSQYPHLSDLINATEQELRSTIKGIGTVKAQQIVAAVQLVKEFTAPLPEPSVICSPSDAHKLLQMHLRYLTKEQFIADIDLKRGIISVRHIMDSERNMQIGTKQMQETVLSRSPHF